MALTVKGKARLQALLVDMANATVWPVTRRRRVQIWNATVRQILGEEMEQPPSGVAGSRHACHDQYCYNDVPHACHKEGCVG